MPQFPGNLILRFSRLLVGGASAILFASNIACANTSTYSSFIHSVKGQGRDVILIHDLMSDVKTVTEILYSLMTTDLRPSMHKLKTRVLLLGASGTMPSEVNKDQLESIYTHQFRSLPSAKVNFNGSTRHFLMLDDLSWLLKQANDFMEAGS